MATIPAEARQWDVRMPGVDIESAPLPAPHPLPAPGAWHPAGAPPVRPRTGTPERLLVPPDAASSAMGGPSAMGAASSTLPVASTARPAVSSARLAASTARLNVPDRSAAKALVARARALWPGLLPRQLADTRGDPRRIVRLAARRSNEAPEVLMRMLLGDRADSDRR